MPISVEEGRSGEGAGRALYDPRYIVVPVEVAEAPTRVSVSIDRVLLKRIDDAAARRGMARSGFLAEAARKLLRAFVG
jgi:HicB_like antitoxin of bacterial toxin-antitoxin system